MLLSSQGKTGAYFKWMEGEGKEGKPGQVTTGRERRFLEITEVHLCRLRILIRHSHRATRE